MRTFVLVSSYAITLTPCSVVQGVEDVIEMHLQRDTKEYTGFLASTRASFHVFRLGLQYRNRDEEEVEGLKKTINTFVEQFQVRTNSRKRTQG